MPINIKTISARVDPEAIREELHKALASLVCIGHGVWPKPCRGCLDEVKGLVHPVRAALVRAAMAVTSPNLANRPANERRKPNPAEHIAVGQAVDMLFDMAKLGTVDRRPDVTVKTDNSPREERVIK